MSHTRGPWKLQPFRDVRCIPIGPGGSQVAHVYGDDEDQTKANANLIAAAPDLLQACELMFESVKTVPGCQMPRIVGAAQFLRMAIMKAKGDL